MTKAQILNAIKQMPTVERLEVVELILKLMREEIEQTENLSLSEAAQLMESHYAEGSELTEFVDSCNEPFYDYQHYA